MEPPGTAMLRAASSPQSKRMSERYREPRFQPSTTGRTRGFLILVSALIFSLAPLSGASRAGDFKVIDGGRLEVGGTVHALYGIKAPALGDKCQVRGNEHDCGILARAGLMDLTAGAKVSCRPSNADPQKSRCRSDGYDLSEGMVYTGWAVALPQSPKKLQTLMKESKARRRGMWRKE